MKILAVCQHYWPEPFNVSEICEELVDRGHEVTVLTGLPNYPEGVIPPEYQHGRNHLQVRNGVQICRVKIVSRGKNLHGFNKLRRIANYFSFSYAGSIAAKRMPDDFDCVLVFQFSPVLMATPGIAYAKKYNVPCIIYCFDLWPEDMLTGGISRKGLTYKIMKKISYDIYNQADTLAITSPNFEDYFKDELGLSNSKYAYLPQFAEEQFELVGASPNNNKLKDTIDFLFAGNIGGNQSVETIIRAASIVSSMKTQFSQAIRIHIIGSGSKLDDCRILADELNVKNVIFYGRKPFEKMPQYYLDADAVLLTLAASKDGSLVRKYTIPRKLQSYLAAGKPVLASTDGAAADIIKKNWLWVCVFC